MVACQIQLVRGELRVKPMASCQVGGLAASLGACHADSQTCRCFQNVGPLLRLCSQCLNNEPVPGIDSLCRRWSLAGQAVKELRSERRKWLATRPDGAQTATDRQILNCDFDKRTRVEFGSDSQAAYDRR